MTYLASIKFQETGQAWDPSWISFEAQVPGRMWQAVWPHNVPGVFLALYRSLQYYKLSLTLEVCLFYPSTFQIIGSFAQFIPFKLEVVIDFVFITHKFSRYFNIDPSLPPSLPGWVGVQIENSILCELSTTQGEKPNMADSACTFPQIWSGIMLIIFVPLSIMFSYGSCYMLL